MRRRREDLSHRPLLDHRAGPHDLPVVDDAGDDGQVMADEEEHHTAFGDEPRQEGEHLHLRRDIERARGLGGDASRREADR